MMKIIIFCMFLGVNISLAFASFKLQLPDDYHGTDVLIEGYCDEAKTFIDAFTIPNQRVVINGMASNVSETLVTLDTRGVRVLVIHLVESVERFLFEVLDLSGLQRFQALEELWIFGGSTRRSYEITFKNISTNFIPTKHVHLNLRLRVDHVPTHYDDIFRFFEFHSSLQTVDMKNLYSTYFLAKLQTLFFSLKKNPLKTISMQYMQSYVQNEEELHRGLNITDVFSTYYSKTMKYLDLSRNSFQFITNHIIKAFPYLKILDLSYNQLVRNFWNCFYEVVLFHPEIQVFNLEQQMLLEINMFYEQTNKDSIFTDQNNIITSIIKNDHSVLKRSATGSVPLFKYVNPECLNETSININQLLTDNNLFCSLITCSVVGLDELPCTYLPTLESLLDVSCAWSITLPIAPHLRQIKFSQPALGQPSFYYMDPKPLCTRSNNIEALDISVDHMLVATFDYNEPVIRGLEQLKDLKMTNIKLKERPALNFSSFSMFPSLERLNLSDNTISLSNDLELCKLLPNIEVLDLSFCKIKLLPENMFSGCKTLKHVVLAHNHLTFLPTKVRNDLDVLQRKADIVIDVSGNLFNCRCHTEGINTVFWLQNTQIHLPGLERYECIGHGGIELVFTKDVDILRDMCSSTGEIVHAVLVSVAACFSIFVTVISILQINKNRYRIKTWYYKMRLSLMSHTVASFEFDIYLCYSPQDRHWVECVLLKALENIYGFKCCVPNRDFPAIGVHIEHIAEYIRKCFVTIVVLNKSAVKNSYHYFERNLSRNLELRTFSNKKTFYIFMEDLGDVKGTDIQIIKNANVWLEWPSSNQQQLVFFDKLLSKLHKNIAFFRESASLNERVV